MATTIPDAPSRRELARIENRLRRTAKAVERADAKADVARADRDDALREARRAGMRVRAIARIAGYDFGFVGRVTRAG